MLLLKFERRELNDMLSLDKLVAESGGNLNTGAVADVEELRLWEDSEDNKWRCPLVVPKA